MRYRVQFDGHYVAEKDNRYLVECKETESDFSQEQAENILEHCKSRVKIFKIITKESLREQNENKK